MAHGYLHEGYGMWGDYDPDREGRERNRDRDWRDRDRDRDRGFMFEDRARSRRGCDDDDREWFGGRERGEDRGAWESNRDWPQRQRETGDRGMSRYGPEQLDFLRYRPVLLNTALKEVLGYVPGKTSAQAFEAFVAARARQGRPVAAGAAVEAA